MIVFEGSNEITFSKETAISIMAQTLSDMFNTPVEVTALNVTYAGYLEIKFRPPKPEKKEMLAEDPPEPDEEVPAQSKPEEDDCKHD